VFVEVVMVKVEEPDALTDAGTKEAEAPAGNPLTGQLAVSANPFRGKRSAGKAIGTS
jgi:hypothetical protein